jgi:hypothetical protein
MAAGELLGPDALEVNGDFSYTERAGSWYETYFHTFGGTISAGSSEIQRNIIAEKVLGLPRS